MEAPVYARVENAIADVPPFAAARTAIWRMIDSLLAAIIRTCEKSLTGRHFELKVATAAMALSLILSFPPYRWMIPAMHMASHNTIRAMALKVQHPFSPIPAKMKDPALAKRQSASHVEKMELRLTIPVLGWLSHTGAWTVPVWSHLAGFGFFWLLARLAFRALGDRVGAALFVVGMGSTGFGSSFFSDCFFGDGVAFFLMLLAVAYRSPIVAGISFLAASFCDERAILAAPLLILYLLIRYGQEDEPEKGRQLSMALIAGALAWALLRFWIAGTFHLSTGMADVATRDILQGTLGAYPEPFLGVFRASWTLIVLAVLSLASQQKWISSAALVSAFTIAVAPAFMVWDFSRSLGYVFPFLLISLYFLRGDKEASHKYLAAVLALNVLYGPFNMTILRALGWLLPATGFNRGAHWVAPS